MKNFFNRPLTPHLTIYSSELTSIYSILHRITALSLIISIIIGLSFFRFTIYLPGKFELNFILSNLLWLKNTLFLILTIFFLYHMLNGIRHVIWDLGFILPIKTLIFSTKIINFVLVSYVFILIKRIIF